MAGQRYEMWAKFHADNPAVWDLFVRFAREAAASGRRRFGARIVGERIRWYTSVETTGSRYKLNDHHLPYYARLAMLMYPAEMEGLFEIRDARFDSTDDEIADAHVAARRAWYEYAVERRNAQ